MGNSTRKDGRVEPGQKVNKAFSARAWNRAQDAADVVLGERTRFGAEAQLGGEFARNVVVVKNNSGVVVPRFGVLGLGDPETLPSGSAGGQFARDVVLKGLRPSGGDQPVGIAIEPIESGNVGRVAVSGRFPAKIKMLSSAHKYARGRKDDVTQLISAECGPFRIVWYESVADNVYAIVIG